MEKNGTQSAQNERSRRNKDCLFSERFAEATLHFLLPILREKLSSPLPVSSGAGGALGSLLVPRWGQGYAYSDLEPNENGDAQWR